MEFSGKGVIQVQPLGTNAIGAAPGDQLEATSDMALANVSMGASADVADVHDATPSISVVMAAYNAASTLDRAVRSVVAQSEAPWELIIVDDGSSDDTASRAAGWADRDHRIRVVNQSNMGASHARNRGISEARGDWIVFLDSDDTLDRRHFGLMLKAVRSTPNAGAAACGWMRIDKKGRPTLRIVPTKDRFTFEAMYANGPPTVIHAYLLPRRVLLREGGFDVRLKTGEDWDLWMRLARMGLQFAVVPKVLALYWDSGGSLTKDLVQVLRDDIALRGFARLPDARISAPLPQHANGFQRDEPRHDYLVSVVFWSATRLGAGQSPPCHLFSLIEPFRPLPTPWAVAHVLCSGLEMLAPGGRQGIAPHWPNFAENLWEFLWAMETWADSPGMALASFYEFELECLRAGKFSGAVRLTHSIGLNLLSFAILRGVGPLPPSIDRLIVRAGFGKRVRIVAMIPLFGPMTGMQILTTVMQRVLRRIERKALGSGFFPGSFRRLGRYVPFVNRVKHALGLGGRRARSVPDPVARIIEQERAKVTMWGESLAAPPVISTTHPKEDSAKGWDRFYEQEDPWDYGNPYEKQKYDDTLELIPVVHGDALEIGCSEGRFTEMLAPKTERLLAVDISVNALARAAQRCERLPHVQFKQIDIFREDLSGEWALIVCSELLYYLPDKPSLRALLSRLFAAMQPGGYLAHAHARSLCDDSSRSGFDWGVPFGADFIAESLSEAGFVRLRTTDREIYRVDLFQKPPISSPVPEPKSSVRSIDCEMPPRVAGGVVWRGAIHTRSQLESEVRRSRMPVLAYHRIADSGPEHLTPWRLNPQQFEEQLIFLRRRGYRGCSPTEMMAGAERRGSLPGRPVMITFDDGYADFYETAWPILQRNGFSAHNFIVTELVGRSAEWDARWGAPAPLMTWDQIIRLSAEGATFGSHLATHTAATYMRTEALLREAVSSRMKLEKALGTPIETVATPFGDSNGVVELVLNLAGYRQHFGNHLDCFAPISSNWMLIPRLFVTSDLNIQDFANLMRLYDERPEAADAPSVMMVKS
jgi:peptidoglycan/xylan/chitin deacetylase (PgdA/CDA1 family)